MKQIDMRFNNNLIQSFVGKKFNSYKCDSFDYTNSVTQTVGLFIDEKTYKLSNVQEVVDYFGVTEDISVFTFSEANEKEIKSAFENVEQIVTPIEGIISKITVINENQKISGGEEAYDVWLTRALIFEVDGREISFEKDNVPFSEEIIIRRGYDLAEKLNDVNDFLEGWGDGITPECKRDVIEISKCSI